MRLTRVVLLCLCGSVLVAGPAFGQGIPDQPMPAPPSDDTSAPAPEDPGAVFGQLRERLTSPRTERRRTAAIQMGRLGDPRAVPLLIQALQHDKQAEVRAAAARALGLLRAESAGGALDLARRKDSSGSVRREAKSALKLLPPSAVPPPQPAASDDRRPATATGTRATNVRRGYADDPQYISGRRLRLGGILTTSIGGGLGLLIGLAGYGWYNACEQDLKECDGSEEVKNNYRAAGVFGFVLAGISIGVGVPLWIIGQRKMNRVVAASRSAFLPRVDLAFGPNEQRTLTARWTF